MSKRLLITGGAGFIGSNLAAHFIKKKYRVTVLDNLSRQGSKANLTWLKSSGFFEFINGDIRKFPQLHGAVRRQDIIFHLAGQVAVTSSVENPRNDFDINALGTFNLLEAVRKNKSKAIVIFSSTNKVYGGMDNLPIIEKEGNYLYRDYPFGIAENFGLDFHSPYGCSKGAADQYVRDYARIYDLPTVVLRQSCIYGPRQFGVEDQGWVAWFIIAIILGKPLTIYGDGKQVRDVLYIDDLVKLFETAVNKIGQARGEVFNVGGGSSNILSVWSGFGPILEELFRKKIKVKFSQWRPGDQKVYISDISKVNTILGWKPEIRVRVGVEKLYKWIKENKTLFK